MLQSNAPAGALVPLAPLDPVEVLPPEIRKAPRKGLRIIGQDEAAEYKRAGAFGFSPSQVDTFRLCPRKWAFGYIDGIRSPSNASAALGSEVHGVWEAYLRDGTPPTPGTLIGKIANATLKYLPLPKVAEVEGETKLYTPLGIMTARIDFWIDDQGKFPRAALGQLPRGWDDPSISFDGVPLIGDHKTTSNFDYTKHPEDLIGDGTRELPGDAQATSYGTIAHVRTGAEVIDLFWSYARTKSKAEALPVRARHTLSTLDPSLVFLFEDVARMRLYRETKAKASEVPVTTRARGACDAFGGCPHRSRCVLTEEEKDQNMADDLASLLGVGGAEPAKSAPVTSPAASVPSTTKPAASSGGDSLESMLGLGSSSASTPAPTSPPPTVPNTAPEAGTEAATAETYERLAAKLFASGKQPPENAAPGVKAAYERIKAQAQIVPDDAPPATVSTPAPVKVETKPETLLGGPLQTTENGTTFETLNVAQTEAKTRKRAAKNPEPLGITANVGDAEDPIALLESAIIAATRAKRFGLVKLIAGVIEETKEYANAAR